MTEREKAIDLDGLTEDGIGYINQSTVSTREVSGAIDKVSRELARWSSNVRKDNRAPSIFNRAAFVTPDSPYALMKATKRAVENDDVVGGVADVTEGLANTGLKWESKNLDDTDVFNQMGADLQLDEFVRQWQREEYTYSQVVVGVWWGDKTYTPRGETETGKRRKKRYNITCPVALTLLNPQKVVPLQPGPFGQDRLAWQATREEYDLIAKGQTGGILQDPVIERFIMGVLPSESLSKAEQDYLTSINVDIRRLALLNPAYVFRFARTKSHYERFASNRLASVLPLLDLKQQLIEADRVALVSAINFIILVKQGTDDAPAHPDEIRNLKENFKVVAKMPVVIGDHRLSIEIITPDQDHTLEAERYDTLDRRILARCLGSLSVASSGQRNESTLTIARAVGRLLESRRHMMKRYLERHIAKAVVDHPANKGKFDGEPNIVFSPRQIQLDTDVTIDQAILQMRQMNELSRESLLEYFGFDEMTEAMRREMEKDSGLDDVFETRVPFSAGNDGHGGDGQSGDEAMDETSQTSGARGGRPNGGGQAANSVKGRVRKSGGKGNTTSKGNK